MWFTELTKESVARELLTAGLAVELSEIRIQQRTDRWVAWLPDDQMAWFASNEAGAKRLVQDRLVLKALKRHCTFRVPEIVFEAPSRRFDVRTMVPGDMDPFACYARALNNTEFCNQLGSQLGQMLAQQHDQRVSDAVGDSLQRVPLWPFSSEWIAENLAASVDDSRLIAQCMDIIGRYEVTVRQETERVVVHTDLGFHNMAIDPATLNINGLYDYDSAVFADPHLDYRFLVFDLDRYELLDAAVAVYQPLTGRTISKQRVILYNAACAVGYLAARAGTPPEQKFAGRTLSEDLHWVQYRIGTLNKSE